MCNATFSAEGFILVERREVVQMAVVHRTNDFIDQPLQLVEIHDNPNCIQFALSDAD